MRISDWSSDVCSSDLPGIRERLLKIWTDPESLNPARRTAEVTRDIAALLARLSTALETRLIRALPANLPAQQAVQHRHAIAEKVALFLMRCLFTMFAEDVGLMKKGSFVRLLEDYRSEEHTSELQSQMRISY